MSAAAKKAFVIFGISVVVVTIILCCVPIRLFDGEVVWVTNGAEVVREQQLSLSYFFGIGLDPEQMQHVSSFRLKTQGWFLVVIFILGIPGLLSYRMYISDSTKKEE